MILILILTVDYFHSILNSLLSIYQLDSSFLTVLLFQNAACVLVPGGFGDRGVRGMILAAKYARENKIPYLGICLGMQISVIEFARSVSDISFHHYLSSVHLLNCIHTPFFFFFSNPICCCLNYLF